MMIPRACFSEAVNGAHEGEFGPGRTSEGEECRAVTVTLPLSQEKELFL